MLSCDCDNLINKQQRNKQNIFSYYPPAGQVVVLLLLVAGPASALFLPALSLGEGAGCRLVRSNEDTGTCFLEPECGEVTVSTN